MTFELINEFKFSTNEKLFNKSKNQLNDFLILKFLNWKNEWLKNTNNNFDEKNE